MDSSLNFIDFLKYGAIGIALALAILSYRLLSKEQEKENVREAMLKSIKTFFILSILLSLFFGITEIITLSMNKKEVVPEYAGVKKVWKRHLSEFPDKSNDEKTERVEEYVELGREVRNASDCSSLEAEVARLSTELEKNDGGFYSNVTKLDKLISSFADQNINIEFDSENKTIVFEVLQELLISLDMVQSRNIPAEDLIIAWKGLKSKWINRDLKYIYHSDIRRLIERYIEIVDARS